MRPITKVQKGIQYWKRNGTKAFLYRLTHPRGIRPIPYDKWFEAHADPAGADGAASCAPARSGSIRICFADGRSPQAEDAAQETQTAYVLFSDPESVFTPDAIDTIAQALVNDPQIDALYADEGFLLPNGKKTAPCFKPDYSPAYLHCVNYIGYPFVVKQEVLDAAGGIPQALEPEGGASEEEKAVAYWELVLRCCAQAQKVAHIARPLVHTPYKNGMQPREHKSELGTKLVSSGRIPDAAEAMLMRLLQPAAAGAGAEKLHAKAAPAGEGSAAQDTRMDAGVYLGAIERAASGHALRPIYLPAAQPKVSILIPNKDETETLRVCLRSILEKTTYANYEILVIENNSESEEIFAYYKELETEEKIRVVQFPGAFNYSRINNFGVARAEGDYLVLLNNDTEVITPDWIERMLGYCMQKDIGIVGAKLLYPDATVQHGGVVIGIGGGASHVLSREARAEDGYLCRLQSVCEVSAVTAACMMIPREVYIEVGGLDESFEVNFNDVTLCLQVREKGYRIVMHAGVELVHYESKSRGLDTSDAKYKRFMGEVYRFREKWKALLEAGDPYYNPNLSLMYVDCRPCYPNEHFAFIEQIEREVADGQI